MKQKQKNKKKEQELKIENGKQKDIIGQNQEVKSTRWAG
jgi:hypothetical protein